VPLYYFQRRVTAMALENYVRHVHTSACFDTIVEIEKAIHNKDDGSALFHLGELREQVCLLHNYLEEFSSTTKPQ
jgi:hypothetical protein